MANKKKSGPMEWFRAAGRSAMRESDRIGRAAYMSAVEGASPPADSAGVEREYQRMMEYNRGATSPRKRAARRMARRLRRGY
jgi:hypothetical protein